MPLALILLLLGCEAPPASTPPPTTAAPAAPAPPEGDPRALALYRADQAATTLATSLRSRLGDALAQGGPERAIQVCASDAPALARSVIQDTGVQVGRASRKLRNKANLGPDWVSTWLAEQEGRPPAEVAGLSQIVETPQGPVARVLRPIRLEASCLACHGAPNSMNPVVLAVLRGRYPEDQALGYQEGDLRGALWAEVAVSASGGG